jgi:hypothetical protein
MKPASHPQTTAARRFFAWAIVQKSGTKATQATGNRIGARKGAANRMADEKAPKIILDIRIVYI